MQLFSPWDGRCRLYVRSRADWRSCLSHTVLDRQTVKPSPKGSTSSIGDKGSPPVSHIQPHVRSTRALGKRGNKLSLRHVPGTLLQSSLTCCSLVVVYKVRLERLQQRQMRASVFRSLSRSSSLSLSLCPPDILKREMMCLMIRRVSLVSIYVKGIMSR